MNTMMKIFALLFAVLVIAPVPSRAQVNYVFSSYQCNPSSCVEIGPSAKTEQVSVNFSGVCTGGAIGGIEAEATTTLLNCTVPYVPTASTEPFTEEYEDDDECPPEPYTVGYVTPISAIYNSAGTEVWSEYYTAGCDGSGTTTTQEGEYPC
jgi:hypothetical protein